MSEPEMALEKATFLQDDFMLTINTLPYRGAVLFIDYSGEADLSDYSMDEYGEANICSGAGRVSLHINSQGGIEPCPFVPLSGDNIRQGGLMAAIKSPFLASIRSRPNLLARDRLACSLFEHFSEVEALLGSSSVTASGSGGRDNQLDWITERS